MLQRRGNSDLCLHMAYGSLDLWLVLVVTGWCWWLVAGGPWLVNNCRSVGRLWAVSGDGEG